MTGRRPVLHNARTCPHCGTRIADTWTKRGTKRVVVDEENPDLEHTERRCTGTRLLREPATLRLMRPPPPGSRKRWPK